MKKVLLSLALICGLAAVSQAADLGSVGTISAESVTEYSYARAYGSPFLSEHSLATGLQLNYGAAGSFALEAGDIQSVTTYRLNSSAFSFGYANGLKLGAVGLVGAVGYTEVTGDRWIGGHNGSPSVGVVTETAELNLALNNTVKLFADYQHADNVNNGVIGDGEVYGTYLNLSKKVSVKLGYVTEAAGSRSLRGGVSSLNVKF